MLPSCHIICNLITSTNKTTIELKLHMNQINSHIITPKLKLELGGRTKEKEMAGLGAGKMKFIG